MEHTTDKLTAIRSCARRLRLSSLTMNAAEELVKAQTSSPSYDDFLLNILNTEVEGREARQKVLRYKAARLPMDHDLNRYDFSTYKGLSLTQLNQLRELHWVEAGYNIMLAGPSGVGKTYVASGLCADAIEHGYKAYFRTMESIMNTLKTRDATPYARAEYRNLCSAQLIVIDDLMNIIVSREEGNILFAWINSVYESTSFIIATAILDRLLYKCELIQLSGPSYRMENRKTIFNNIEQNNENR